MDTIPIAQVLSEIRSSTDQTQPFLIVFVKSTGRSRGAVRTIARCIKGLPSRKDPIAKGGTGQGQINYKERDVIPLIDIEDGHSLKTIRISHIIGYNHYTVIH